MMGGLSSVQNNVPNVGAMAPAVSNNVNGIGNAAMSSMQNAVDATMSQAYTGIQQYAGLSGLLNQGKVPFFSNSVGCVLVLILLRPAFPMAGRIVCPPASSNRLCQTAPNYKLPFLLLVSLVGN